LIGLGMGNALGPFDFNSENRQNEWNKCYQLLISYVEEHGNADVIERKERDQHYSLAQWIRELPH
jgi:hypothetical protein